MPAYFKCFQVLRIAQVLVDQLHAILTTPTPVSSCGQADHADITARSRATVARRLYHAASSMSNSFNSCLTVQHVRRLCSLHGRAAEAYMQVSAMPPGRWLDVLTSLCNDIAANDRDATVTCPACETLHVQANDLASPLQTLLSLANDCIDGERLACGYTNATRLPTAPAGTSYTNAV